MKISTLTENVTPISTPNGNNPSSAPKFGRDPKVLETSTTSGVIGPGATANMGVQRRGTGALFKGIKTSKKFPNSNINEEHDDKDEQRQKYVQSAKDVLKGADFDHIVRIRDLDKSTLERFLNYAWDKLNKGEYKLNRPNLEETSVAEASQRVDSLVTNSLKIMKGPTIDDAITALKTVLGDREYNSRRDFYSFYIKQLMDMYSQQGVAEGEVLPFKRPQSGSLTWQQLPQDVLSLVADWYWAEQDDSSVDAMMDPKGLGSGTSNNLKYITAKLQQHGYNIDYNDENDKPGEFNIKLTNKRGQTVLLPVEDAQDFKGWAINTGSNVQEQEINELGSTTLLKARNLARQRRDQAMDPEIHNALGGGYMNPVAKHYDTMAQKFDTRAQKVATKDKIKDIGVSDVALRKINQAKKVNETENSLSNFQHAEENKRSADAAKNQGDMYAYHLHMADYHKNMYDYNNQRNQHAMADRHQSKARDHSFKASQYKKLDVEEVSEEVIATNLYKDLQLYKKGQDKTIGSKSKSKDLSTKPIDKDIINKVKKSLDEAELDENLRKWFKEKWVRFGPDGKIRGSCARGDDSEGKPKCLPQAKAHALGKKGRKYAASKKRREDPNPERRGPAKNVATKKKSNENISEVSTGDYYKKAKLSKALAQIDKTFYPDKPGSDLTIQKREKGLARLQARSDKEREIQAKKAEQERLDRLQQDVTNLPELKLQLQNLMKDFDPKYDYADVGNYGEWAKQKSLHNQILQLKNRIAKAEQQSYNQLDEQGVAEGFLGDREFNRVMPFVKRIAGEVTDYDRDEFGEELWSLLDQKYGSKFAQSVLDDLDVYWYEYSDMTGQGVAEGIDPDDPWGPQGNFAGDKPVNVGGTFPAKPVVKQGSLVKASGLTGVYRVMYIRGDQAKIVQEIPNTGDSTYFPMSDLRVWTNKPVKEQGVAEGLGDALKGVWDKISDFDSMSPKYNGNTPRREALRKKLELQKKQQQQQKQQQGVVEDQLDELKCWPGYTRVKGVPAGAPGSCKKKTSEAVNAAQQAAIAISMKKAGKKPKKTVEEGITTRDIDRTVHTGSYGKTFNASKGNTDVFGRQIDEPKQTKTTTKKEIKPTDDVVQALKDMGVGKIKEEKCPHCNGPMFAETMMNEKKDACYYKVKSRYKVWPSAYASGALVKCRKKGASNWGNKSESVNEEQLDEKWSEKYKKSINCNNPKGFSQRAHCQGRKKK